MSAVVVLAAGKGTRMRSSRAKVMHEIAGEPMLAHVLRAARALSTERVVVVTAPGMEEVRQAAKDCTFAEQSEQKGTGHAVACALPQLEGITGDILVLYGDTPLVKADTLKRLLEAKREMRAAIALCGMQPQDPTGYGRLVMPSPPYVTRIVECKDASAEEKRIPWVWGGVMAFDAGFLRDALPRLAPSPVTGEYYLTALIEEAQNRDLTTLNVPMAVEEAMGVNTRAQLAEAEAALQSRLRRHAMEQGATLVAPETVFFSADTVLGEDVRVQPFVRFGRGVQVGAGAEIKSFTHLEGAHVGAGCTVGPYARLRPGAVLEAGAMVGNFVEVKNTTLREGAKAGHLSYLGDAEVGAHANIGAGTITCNYDGKAKHRTDIGENAFIGSNTSLVAPVTIGANALVGAGSVITEDVPEGALALGRARQVVKG